MDVISRRTRTKGRTLKECSSFVKALQCQAVLFVIVIYCDATTIITSTSTMNKKVNYF